MCPLAESDGVAPEVIDMPVTHWLGASTIGVKAFAAADEKVAAVVGADDFAAAEEVGLEEMGAEGFCF